VVYLDEYAQFSHPSGPTNGNVTMVKIYDLAYYRSLLRQEQPSQGKDS